MKYHFLILALLFVFNNVYAQDFKVNKLKSDKSIIYNAHNPTDNDVYITMHFSGYGFRTKYISGTELHVPAHTDKMTLATLTFQPSKGRSINVRYSIRKVQRIVPSNEPIVKESPSNINPKPSLPSKPKVDPFAKGISLFTMSGCGRCSGTKASMDNKKIDYTHYNIDKSKDNALMWEQIQKAGFKGGKIKMPVIVIDGKVHYNINNLSELLKKMK